MTYREAIQSGQEAADRFQQRLVVVKHKRPHDGYALIYWHQWCNGVQPPYQTEVVSLIEPR